MWPLKASVPPSSRKRSPRSSDKSLVTSDRTTAMRYRLLDTTRAYAWQKLTESGEDPKIVRRHCEHMIHALEQLGATIWAPPSPESIDFFALNLGNLRAALEWSFSDQGDTGLGAKLAGASACLFFQAGLLPECAAWTERALGALDTLSKGTQLELELLACFASSLMVTKGNVPATHDCPRFVHWTLRSASRRLRCSYISSMRFISGRLEAEIFAALRELTDRIETVAKQIADPLADAIAHGLSAVTSFYHRRQSRGSQACTDCTRRPGSPVETQPGEFWASCTG